MNEFDRRAWNWDADAAKHERAQRVAEAIDELAGPLEGLEALEYGCGTGLLGFALQPRLARVTLADSSQGMLAVLREKIAASGAANLVPLELDLATGPVPAERFDLVCTLMVLHHIPDTAGILARFHQLLRPGGRVCIADLDREDGSFHGAGAEVHRGFDREELGAALVQAGFRQVRFTTPYVVHRLGEHGEESYPLFLAVADRP